MIAMLYRLSGLVCAGCGVVASLAFISLLLGEPVMFISVGVLSGSGVAAVALATLCITLLTLSWLQFRVAFLADSVYRRVSSEEELGRESVTRGIKKYYWTYCVAFGLVILMGPIILYTWQAALDDLTSSLASGSASTVWEEDANDR